MGDQKGNYGLMYLSKDWKALTVGIDFSIFTFGEAWPLGLKVLWIKKRLASCLRSEYGLK